MTVAREAAGRPGGARPAGGATGAAQVVDGRAIGGRRTVRADVRVTSILNRPVIRYGLNARDTARFQRGLERLAELFLAAGAREVVLPVAGRHELRAGERPSLAGLRAGDLKLMAFHPLGTARAHADPAQGVVDAGLRLHGAHGVHVADGSVVPGPLGVNPQITVMALASRLAGRLLEATTEVQHACRS